MRVFASKLINTKLLDSAYKVRGFVIEPDTGKLLSIAVSEDFEQLVSFDDVIWEHGSKRFELANEGMILDRDELVRSAEVIESGRILKNQKVVTDNGLFIGILKDFEMDVQQGILTQIQTRRAWYIYGRKRLIPRKRILEIKQNLIRIDDDKEFVEVIQKEAEPVAPPA